MKQALSALLLLSLLCGCDTIGESLEPPAMQKPIGIPSTIPPQDTPELEARAAKEREDLPQIPPIADPETYSSLGTVPPKPVMPSEAEIASQIKGLAAEETTGSAVIAAQADADEPEILPKPAPTKGKASKQQTTTIAPTTASQQQVFSGNASPFLPQSQDEQTDLLPANAP